VDEDENGKADPAADQQAHDDLKKDAITQSAEASPPVFQSGFLHRRLANPMTSKTINAINARALSGTHKGGFRA
jgi:hypothetical protein